MLTGELLRRSAARAPRRTAIVHGERRMSYAEFDAAANRLANALLSLGLSNGAKVAIMASNCPEYAVAYFGMARAGLVSAHLSVRSTGDDIAYMLDKSEAEGLVVEAAFLPAARDALPRLRRLRHLVVIGGPPPGTAGCETIAFDDLLAGQPATPPAVPLSEHDPLAITYTGGTTGFPKAVLASHRARAVTALTAAMEFGLDEHDVVAVPTPLFHAAGLFVWFAPAILLGATTVLMGAWSVPGFVDLVERESVTAAFLVPTQINDLLSDPAFDPARLAGLRKLGYAGAPMPPALVARLQAALPRLELTENYGQSETGPMTVRQPLHGAGKLATVGRPAFLVDVAVVDETGAALPPGRIGEIVTRGDHLFTGYYGDPEQTAAAFPRGDGWLWTGDLGYMDEDGFLTLVDRSKDMIIVGGENIYPAEIENALYGHPAVAACAVFGIPDERLGEAPAAHVVLARGRAATEAELIDFCASRIARHKRPRLVRFVDTLPRTAVGKIQKTTIREPYWAGRDRRI